MAAPLATDDEVALCTREHAACRKRKGGTGPEYMMFSAAAEGCLQCVRYCVERADIPYNAQSENSRYTALDFTQWAATQEQTDTQAVQQYLKSCDDLTAVQQALLADSAMALQPPSATGKRSLEDFVSPEAKRCRTIARYPTDP